VAIGNRLTPDIHADTGKAPGRAGQDEQQPAFFCLAVADQWQRVSSPVVNTAAGMIMLNCLIPLTMSDKNSGPIPGAFFGCDFKFCRMQCLLRPVSQFGGV